ncbi:MAG: prolipoprotein diacylglyceryl transferase, partial [Candidatus Eisenbacteria bacterium]
MFPELVAFGPFHLRTFGLLLATAFLVGTWISLGEARRRGIDETKLVNLVLVILVTSILGARGFYVATHPAETAGDPLAFFRLWEGGLTLIGGFVAGTIAGFAYMKHAGLPMGVAADTVTPAVALGVAIARIGCFLNGCCFGRPCDLPWGVHFPPGSPPDLLYPGQALHPSQIYNALAFFALFLLTLWLRPRLKGEGQLWWLFVILFALVRFPIDATRHYEASAYVLRWAGGGMTDSELIGVGLIVAGAFFFW